MKLSCKFNYSNVNYNKENEVDILIKAEAPLVEWQGERKPINIIAVIDTSTSMGTNDKIAYAKKSLMKLIDNLSAQDKLGVIEFNSSIRILSEPIAMTTENKQQLKDQEIKRLQPTGMTNYHQALLTALQEAKSIIDQNVRIIFFTDGCPTCGITDKRTILSMQKTEIGKNTTLSCFGYGKITDAGFGNAYDPQFLSDMAVIGKGNFAYVENPDDALTAFAKELGGLLSCYGQDLKFKVKLKEDMAKIKEIYSDFDIEEKADHIAIAINDIYSEEAKNIVMSLRLPKQPSVLPREINVLDVELEYLDVKTNKPKVETVKGKIRFVKEEDVDTKQNQEVVDQVSLAKLVKAQQEAEKHASKGDYKTAGVVLLEMSDNIVAHGASSDIIKTSSVVQDMYMDAAAYTSSTGIRCSLSHATKGGRSTMGLHGPLASAYAQSNQSMDSMVNTFTKDQNHAVSNFDHVAKEKDDEKNKKKKDKDTERRTLAQKRSSLEW